MQPPSHGGHEVRGPRRLLWRLRHGPARHDSDSIPPTDHAIPCERPPLRLRSDEHQHTGDEGGDARKEQDVQPSLAIPPLTTPPRTTVRIADPSHRYFLPSTDASSAGCSAAHRKAKLGRRATGAAKESDKIGAPKCLVRGSGAGGRIRTDDLLFTRQLLCQLSYASLRPSVLVRALTANDD